MLSTIICACCLCMDFCMAKIQQIDILTANDKKKQQKAQFVMWFSFGWDTPTNFMWIIFEIHTRSQQYCFAMLFFCIGWVCRVLVCHTCEQCRHPKYKVMTHFNCTLSDNQHSFIACNPGRKIILFYRELKFPRTSITETGG